MKDEPDGYIITHHRAGSTCYFGPFATIQETVEWNNNHPKVRGAIIPVFKTVDWNR